MKTLIRISTFIADHMAWLILAVALAALLCPGLFTWISAKAVNPLLGIVMFGMGLTLKVEDFRIILSRPKDIMLGALAQFIIMPSLAFILCQLFSLDRSLMVGVILVGCCPGGTASNVITYLAKGDVALSVGMTTVSTLLAPVLTPLLVLLLASASVDVDASGMFLSICQVVLLPVIAGLAISHYAGQRTEMVKPVLPMVSTVTIAVIIAIVVSRNSSQIISCSLLIWAVVICHNVLGLLLGLLMGKMAGMAPAKRSALAIEVGMQNSGLATGIATAHFAAMPMAAVPGAIFSVWHNFSGSIAAMIFRRTMNSKEE